MMKNNETFTKISLKITALGDRFWLQLMSEWLVDLQRRFDKDFESGLITRHGIPPNATVLPSTESILAYKLLCNAGDEIRRSRVSEKWNFFCFKLNINHLSIWYRFLY